MKKFTFIILSAILLSAICNNVFYKQTSKRIAKPGDLSENILEPNERMLLERSYPDAQFDYIAYQKAQSDAYQKRFENKNKSMLINWTVEGPGNIGGRFNCIAVHPTNSNIMYAGAATGGIFKTTDGGANWLPVFDSQQYLAIGCITIDPNNPNTVWAGTGDANISGLCYIGDGIYKSTDAGATWTNMGLNNQHVFTTICIDPGNSNVLYASTMGQPFIRDNKRGLFKSVDGGVTWNSVLFVSNQAGIMDLVMNPTNPLVLYAASYDRIRNNQESLIYGSNTKIYKTINGGTSWTILTTGLPAFPVSRIGLTIYPSNPNILYTIIADSTQYVQGIYKTVDAGSTWTTVNTATLDPTCYNGYGWYFGKIYVNPTNSNQIYVLGVDSYTTTDGGSTWNPATPPWYMYIVHGDHHFMNFISGTTILLCTDGGIYKTTDNCATWTDIENIPVNQVYHANENPFTVGDYWCGVQDNGTSNGNASAINSWNRIFGGDGFQSNIDPTNANIFYAETQNGAIVYTDDGGSTMFDGTLGINTADTRNWDMPYIISKFDNTTLYTGTNQVYQMLGAPYGTWYPISADLSDGLGLYRDDLHTITTISESPVSASVLYAGTADANVWSTTNGGATWNNVTGSLPNRYVTAVAASPNVLNNIYVTHSGYRDGDNIPHIHKSINNGTTWTDISGDIPQLGVNDILVTPGKENIIFVSTDAGVYYTVNSGVNWSRLGSNMPMMPVFDIEFNNAKTKVIASTFARSVQTIDISSITSSVGIDDTSSFSSVLIYPNPSTDILKIRLNTVSKLNYTIYDLQGKLCKKSILNNETIFSIPVADLPKGSYLIQLETENKTSIHHFVKM